MPQTCKRMYLFASKGRYPSASCFHDPIIQRALFVACIGTTVCWCTMLLQLLPLGGAQAHSVCPGAEQDPRNPMIADTFLCYFKILLLLMLLAGASRPPRSRARPATNGEGGGT